MSQFPGGYDDPYATPSMTRRTSALAIAAFVCSLIFCCPITTIPGLIMGLFAIVQTGPASARKGRGLAIAAVIIALLGLTFQVWVGYSGYQAYKIAFGAPNEIFQAAESGDLTGFRSYFVSAAASTSDAEVQAYIDGVRARYGQFQSAEIETFRMGGPRGDMPVFVYRLTFEKATVTAEALLDPKAQTRDDRMMFDSFTIIDSARGDLEFPPAAPAAPAASGPAADPAAGDAPETTPPAAPEPGGDEPATSPDTPPATPPETSGNG